MFANIWREGRRWIANATSPVALALPTDAGKLRVSGSGVRPVPSKGAPSNGLDKLCASGCRVPSVTAWNAPNRLHLHCYTCLSWDHKRLTITGISYCFCQCFFSFKMNTNSYVFNFANDPVFTISHAQCSLKLRKVVSLIELHQFLTPLAMRLSYYIVKRSWYRYFAVYKGG